MCLYAAPVRPDDLGTLARFVDDGERHLHLCVGCAMQGLEANELESAELSDNDATALSMTVGASGMGSVYKDDYTKEIINPMSRGNVLLLIKSLDSLWIQTKIKDIGIPAIMQWLVMFTDTGCGWS